ncbi:proline iminopeptidase [Maridesulfovibrio ferrireducens]|uniref:Proline iminopeptidase n=2 Tax=Maridesulfovibrio ferrireducens TaxID=246191 RepID=A0A1G9LFP5_9BACT|nr:proline iminopeptidase [Maridesulfovibrio ferrireducens]
MIYIINHRRLFCWSVFCTLIIVMLIGCVSRGEKDMNKEQAYIDKILTEPAYDSEGFVDYTYEGHTYKLWYGRIGSGSAPPALVLHGGPGGNHHNLVAFQALSDERPVIFYDQLGCGNSERPDNPALWNAERYFDEVKAVRDGLGLKKYHLIGHSWGTAQAVGFAAKHPAGILSISLHSPILSFPYYITDVAPALKQGLICLNGKGGQVIDDYELRGVGTKSDYDEACMEFTKKHVTHTWPLPEAMKKLGAARNSAIHDTMVAGGSELNVLGNIKTIDVTTQLSKLNVPILMTCGSDDLCTPAYTKWQSEFANNPQYYVIQGSAHMTPVDKPLELIERQRVFLKEFGSRVSHEIREASVKDN